MSRLGGSNGCCSSLLLLLLLLSSGKQLLLLFLCIHLHEMLTCLLRVRGRWGREGRRRGDVVSGSSTCWLLVWLLLGGNAWGGVGRAVGRGRCGAAGSDVGPGARRTRGSAGGGSMSSSR